MLILAMPGLPPLWIFFSQFFAYYFSIVWSWNDKVNLSIGLGFILSTLFPCLIAFISMVVTTPKTQKALSNWFPSLKLSLSSRLLCPAVYRDSLLVCLKVPQFCIFRTNSCKRNSHFSLLPCLFPLQGKNEKASFLFKVSFNSCPHHSLACARCYPWCFFSPLLTAHTQGLPCLVY